jgi:hypothetical protein
MKDESRWKVVLSALAILLFAGCNPYEFDMGSTHIVRCKVLTSLPTVSQGHSATTLRDTGAIDLNYFGATQYLLTMDVKLLRGTGFRMLLRPVVEQRDVKDSGIVLIVTNNGVWLDSNRQIFLTRRDVQLQPNQQLPILLLSENNFMTVVLGCDTIYKGWSKIKESDDVVVQALEGSEIQVIAPDWAGLPDR